jgi:hypothetical protein
MVKAAFNNQNTLYIKKKTFSGSRVFPCGRTDRNDKADSRFSQFCEHA